MLVQILDVQLVFESCNCSNCLDVVNCLEIGFSELYWGHFLKNIFKLLNQAFVFLLNYFLGS